MNKDIRILVACEESQAVTIELRKLGFIAFSCDLLPCSGGYPEWHIQGNCLLFLGKNEYNDFRGWDLMISHPPCTYLSNAAARHLFPKRVLNQERYKKGLEAKDFFMKLYNAPIPRIVVENPTPSKIYDLPKHTQVIQPYEYGEPYKKRTLLWIKNLPLLEPTNIVAKPLRSNTKIPGNWFNKGGKQRKINRSKTFPGIARAMAEQWTRCFR